MTDSEAFARRTLLTMVAKAVQMQGNTTAAERRALDVMVSTVQVAAVHSRCCSRRRTWWSAMWRRRADWPRSTATWPAAAAARSWMRTAR